MMTYYKADDVLLHTVPDSPPGVYLYLGYSRIDAEVLKQGRMKLNDEVPLVIIFSQFACVFELYLKRWKATMSDKIRVMCTKSTKRGV